MNKDLRYFFCVALFAFACAVSVSAQIDKREVRSGNRDFRNREWREAEIDYMKALLKDSLSFAANYNLGSALYRQEEYAKAREAMEKAVSSPSMDFRYAADVYFNLGDAALAQKDWKTAADAFMQSLIADPDDLQAKENFIYARMMMENSGGQDGDGGDQDDNKDDSQDDNDGKDDKKDNGGEDDSRDNEGVGNDDKDDGGHDSSGDGRQESRLTPQAAQQMLQAIQAKEKETQDKVQKAKAAASRSRQREKNW